jgi:hypothetical protein
MGVAVKNGKFIGPPMVGLANSVLRKHEMILNKPKVEK